MLLSCLLSQPNPLAVGCDGKPPDHATAALLVYTQVDHNFFYIYIEEFRAPFQCLLSFLHGRQPLTRQRPPLSLRQ